MLSEEVEAEPATEGAIREIYDGNPDGFMSPPLLEASHILIAPAEAGSHALEAA
ncbi:MAG: peptidase, partial [Deltaproteobacteria bacterium]|nr:peptidase [Deltaproteobacteria bacterium]